MAAMNEVRWCSRPVIGSLLAAGVALAAAFVLAPAALLDGRIRHTAGLGLAVGR
jgi:hypothetical protein